MGVPTLHPGMSTDTKQPGPAGRLREGPQAQRPCAAPNPRHRHRLGTLDSHNTMYLPQSVVDNEMAGMARRLFGEVEVSEATLASASISRVGPGGGFLGERETAKRIRAGEHYLPKVSDRFSYGSGSEAGLTENDAAAAEVERLLARHARAAVPGGREDRRTRRRLRRGRGPAGAARCGTDPRGAPRPKHPREAPERRNHDAQDRLHRARRPRQAPRRQPAAGRLPGHRVRHRQDVRHRPGEERRRVRGLHRGDGARVRHRSSRACPRRRRSLPWSPKRAASSRRSPPAAPGST